MHTPRVETRVQDAVGTIVLNRPRVLNCIDEELAQELEAAIEAMAAVDALRVVVVRGAGRAFCSGLDLRALGEDRIGQAFFRRWEKALQRLETLEPVVVAAIHSHCIGGGLQLALACDLRIARADARLAITAVNEGIIPGIGVWRIARHAGLGRAKRLALTTDTIDASTAERWGLVDYLADAATFETAISDLTTRLAAAPRTSSRLVKKLANLAFDLPQSEFVEVFLEYQRQSTGSEEHKAAMAGRATRSGGRACGSTS